MIGASSLRLFSRKLASCLPSSAKRALDISNPLPSFKFDEGKRVNLQVAAGSYRADLEKAAEKDNIEQRERIEIILGKDPFCPDWDYEEAEHLPDVDDFVTQGWATAELLRKHQCNILLFYCSTLVLSIFAGSALRGIRSQAVALFGLKGRLHDYQVNKVACFRAEFVWPLWGSSQAFWEELCQVLSATRYDYNYCWPKGRRHLTLGQAKEFFESVGCQEGMRLCRVIMSINDTDYELTSWPLHLPMLA